MVRKNEHRHGTFQVKQKSIGKIVLLPKASINSAPFSRVYPMGHGIDCFTLVV